MSKYALVDEDGTVINTIVADEGYEHPTLDTIEVTGNKVGGPGAKYDDKKREFIPPESQPTPRERFVEARESDDLQGQINALFEMVKDD